MAVSDIAHCSFKSIYSSAAAALTQHITKASNRFISKSSEEDVSSYCQADFCRRLNTTGGFTFRNSIFSHGFRISSWPGEIFFGARILWLILSRGRLDTFALSLPLACHLIFAKVERISTLKFLHHERLAQTRQRLFSFCVPFPIKNPLLLIEIKAGVLKPFSLLQSVRRSKKLITLLGVFLYCMRNNPPFPRKWVKKLISPRLVSKQAGKIRCNNDNGLNSWGLQFA